MNAKLLLRSMTLRGIGSYLHGTRLEFRPLTILCGTNGSGKSTWFKALNLLKTSLERAGFPFGCSGFDNFVEDIRITNAYVFLLDPKDINQKNPASLSDKSQESEFGPPCTIGLQFEAIEDFELTDVSHKDANCTVEPQKFFWQGKCKRGTKFDVRIAYPSNGIGGGERADLSDFVELQIDEVFIIRFKSIGCIGSGKEDLYSVECSAGFLPQLSGVDGEKLVEVGTYRHSSEITRADYKTSPGLLGEDDLRLFIQTARTRIRELVKLALEGFFYISAIRQPQLHGRLYPAFPYADRDEELPEKREAAVKSRYVGSQGEFSWFCERSFEENIMQVDWCDHSGEKVPFEGYLSKWTEKLVDTKIVIDDTDSDLQRYSKDCGEEPVGFLLDETARPIDPRDGELEFSGYMSREELGKLCHPCNPTQPQNPRQMSSGFHQLFPLIVQSGLMRNCELMAVENPEVHLHPGLQLRIAEFFLKQAAIGKWIILETHSDLIIRRILRSILQEETPQESIRIYFSDITKSEEFYDAFPKKKVPFHYSTLNPIKIDERGRVKNWPPGFLDDNVKESQRLLDIMYGGPPDEAEDDE